MERQGNFPLEFIKWNSIFLANDDDVEDNNDGDDDDDELTS